MDHDDAMLKRIVKHYRELAADAQGASQEALSKKYRRAYSRMAKHWTGLANEIEKCMDSPGLGLN
jgi:hypothetical protein